MEREAASRAKGGKGGAAQISRTGKRNSRKARVEGEAGSPLSRRIPAIDRPADPRNVELIATRASHYQRGLCVFRSVSLASADLNDRQRGPNCVYSMR